MRAGYFSGLFLLFRGCMGVAVKFCSDVYVLIFPSTAVQVIRFSVSVLLFVPILLGSSGARKPR